MKCGFHCGNVRTTLLGLGNEGQFASCELRSCSEAAFATYSRVALGHGAVSGCHVCICVWILGEKKKNLPEN